MPSDLMPLVTIWRRAGECLGQGWKRRLTAVEGYVLQGTASAFDRGCVSCGITKGGEQQRWEGRGGGEERKKSKYPTSLCSKSQRSPLGGSDAPEKWLFSPFVLDVGPLHSASSNHTTIQPRGESKTPSVLQRGGEASPQEGYKRQDRWAGALNNIKAGCTVCVHSRCCFPSPSSRL